MGKAVEALKKLKLFDIDLPLNFFFQLEKSCLTLAFEKKYSPSIYEKKVFCTDFYYFLT